MNDSYFDAFARVYDEFTQNAEYDKRADYICKLLGKAGVNSGILLDLACGTGTLSVRFAEKGFDVIGVDFSEDMLIAAREKLAEAGKNALMLCQDMRELDLYGTVNACVCSLDSLNHLTEQEDVQTVFNKVSLFIEPGGVFIFDVNTLYKHRTVLADNAFVYENENSFLVWQNELCEDNATVNIYIDIFTEEPPGSYLRDSEEFSEKAYAEEEIRSMLEKAGFCDITVYGDMTFSVPTATEERIYFSARKK